MPPLYLPCLLLLYRILPYLLTLIVGVLVVLSFGLYPPSGCTALAYLRSASGHVYLICEVASKSESEAKSRRSRETHTTRENALLHTDFESLNFIHVSVFTIHTLSSVEKSCTVEAEI